MDLMSLAAAKNYTNKVAAGVTAARVEGNSIILTLVDGSEAKCTLPAPKDGTNGLDGKDGISVVDLSIDTDGSLLCHMSDGQIIDAGYVPTVDPDLTNYYTKNEMDTALQNINTTETVMFYSTETAQQRKDKYFHLIDLYKKGKKFNAFFYCPANTSVLGSSFKPSMPTMGFMYELSFGGTGSYNYKYSIEFLVKTLNGNTNNIADEFSKIQMFSESEFPSGEYHEQVTALGDYAFVLQKKKDIVTKKYVDDSIATAITSALEGEY